MRVGAPGACGVGRGSERVIGRRRRGDDLRGRANRGRDAWPDVLWSGFGDGGRCGARRTSAAVPRATWIRPRSNRKMLETPPLSTAAKPAFDPVARCGVPPGARALEATTIAATAAIARTAVTPATARRSTRRERIAGVLPEPLSTSSWTAGAWSALCTAAECSPQKSSALGGAASRLGGASRRGWRVQAGWKRAEVPWGRVQARWRVRARRRCVRLAGRGSRTERHQLLAGSEPVARQAYHLAPRLSLSLFRLGLPTFPQRVDDLFQRFLRRRRQCRPSRAVL